jgi:hypothetical protein
LYLNPHNGHQRAQVEPDIFVITIAL